MQRHHQLPDGRIARNNLNELMKTLIYQAIDDYLDYHVSKQQTCCFLPCFGLFHKHGRGGIKKAQALRYLVTRSSDFTTTLSYLADFFNNSLEVNHKKFSAPVRTNNHSFVSFLLNALNQKKFDCLHNALAEASDPQGTAKLDTCWLNPNGAGVDYFDNNAKQARNLAVQFFRSLTGKPAQVACRQQIA